MNNLIYTLFGINKLSKCKKDNHIIDEYGDIKSNITIINNNIKNGNVFKMKINNSIDNIILPYNTKILSIQNIPGDLRLYEIPGYMDNNTRYSKITFNNIKDLTDFDYICYPIPKFNKKDNDDNHHDYDFHRFLGINLMNNFNNNIILINEKNKNTIAFLNKYLFNNNITYEKNDINDMSTEFKFNCPFNNFNFNYNNISEENSKALLKGIVELYYIKNPDNDYINIKINLNSRNIIYIIKFLFMKFGILISTNYIDNYYVVKIPKIGIICELFNIPFSNIENLPYFVYNGYICSKIKSIAKVSKFNGNIYILDINDKYVSEVGVLYHNSLEK
jgi:hypothetical protein